MYKVVYARWISLSLPNMQLSTKRLGNCRLPTRRAVAISPYQFLMIGGTGPEGHGQVLKYEERAWAVWPRDGWVTLVRSWATKYSSAVEWPTMITPSPSQQRQSSIWAPERRGMVEIWSWHGLAILNNKLVVFGGGNGNAFCQVATGWAAKVAPPQ